MAWRYVTLRYSWGKKVHDIGGGGDGWAVWKRAGTRTSFACGHANNESKVEGRSIIYLLATSISKPLVLSCALLDLVREFNGVMMMTHGGVDGFRVF